MAIQLLSKSRYRAAFMLDGIRYSKVFATKADAQAWEAYTRNQLAQGSYLDTRRTNTLLGEYGSTWIRQRELKPNVRNDYENTWKRYIAPKLGKLRLTDLTPELVRNWYSDVLQQVAANSGARANAGKATASKSYRILKAVMATALDDGLVRSNPCKIPAGGINKPKERQALSVEQVFQVAATVLPRYSALVHLLAYSGLRIGEASALTRSDLDLSPQHPTVTVSARVYKLTGGIWDYDKPKTAAGVRTVALPPYLVPILQAHLEQYSQPGANGLVFTTAANNPASGAASKAIKKALRALGLSELVTHDLRHTAATTAAKVGAPLPDLMQMLGHATPAASLIYLHAEKRGNTQVADAVSSQIEAANVIPLRRTSNG